MHTFLHCSVSKTLLDNWEATVLVPAVVASKEVQDNTTKIYGGEGSKPKVGRVNIF